LTVDTDQTTKDAQRYRLLRDYLLGNGFVVHEKVEEGNPAFVMDTDFYGLTFDDAVDSLAEFSQSLNAIQRAVVYEMPSPEESPKKKR
jgi:hypothetical protein